MNEHLLPGDASPDGAARRPRTSRATGFGAGLDDLTHDRDTDASAERDDEPVALAEVSAVTAILVDATLAADTRGDAPLALGELEADTELGEQASTEGGARKKKARRRRKKSTAAPEPVDADAALSEDVDVAATALELLGELPVEPPVELADEVEPSDEAPAPAAGERARKVKKRRSRRRSARTGDGPAAGATAEATLFDLPLSEVDDENGGATSTGAVLAVPPLETSEHDADDDHSADEDQRDDRGPEGESVEAAAERKRRRRGSRGGRRRKAQKEGLRNSDAASVEAIPGEIEDDLPARPDARPPLAAEQQKTGKKRRRRRKRRPTGHEAGPDREGGSAPRSAVDEFSDDEGYEDDSAPHDADDRATDDVETQAARPRTRASSDREASDAQGDGRASKRGRRKRKVALPAEKSADELAAEAEVLRTQTILVNAVEPEEKRVAVIEGERIVDLLMTAESQKTLVNDVYRGKVVNLEPAIGAAFIDFGQGRNGFLHTSDVLPIYGDKDFELEHLLTARVDFEEWSEDERVDPRDLREDDVEDHPFHDRHDEHGPEDDHDHGDELGHEHDDELVGDELAPTAEAADGPGAHDEPEEGSDEGADERAPAGRPSRGTHAEAERGRGARGENRRQQGRGRAREMRVKGRMAEHRKGRDRRPITDLLRVGDSVVVQITKDAIGDKGPTLTTYISIPGRYLVLMPSMSRTGVSRKIPDEKERRRLKKILASLDVPQDMGVIVRTAGVGKKKEDLARDLDYLLGVWEGFGRKLRASRGPSPLYQESDVATRTLRDLFSAQTKRVLVDDYSVHEQMCEFAGKLLPEHVSRIELYDGERPIFHQFGIEQDFEKVFMRRVELPSGGSVVFDQAEALVAIDVNSGRTRTDSFDFEKIALKTNLEAVKEIALQIRLRDLGGIIVCDFIDMMKPSSNRQVERALKDELDGDRARSKLGRISQFGLLELTRQRLGPGTHKKVFQACPRCRGTGRVRTLESRAQAILRRLGSALTQKGFTTVEVKAHPEVVRYLKEDLYDYVRAMEHRMEREIRFIAAPEQTEDSVLSYMRADGREVRPGGRRKR